MKKVVKGKSRLGWVVWGNGEDRYWLIRELDDNDIMIMTISLGGFRIRRRDRRMWWREWSEKMEEDREWWS